MYFIIVTLFKWIRCPSHTAASIPVALTKGTIRAIEDYYQHNFLDVLSSVGGLLAVLQGLHVLCFGRPLFWGMFGAKFLNPGSNQIKASMIEQYSFTRPRGHSARRD